MDAQHISLPDPGPPSTSQGSEPDARSLGPLGRSSWASGSSLLKQALLALAVLCLPAAPSSRPAEEAALPYSGPTLDGVGGRAPLLPGCPRDQGLPVSLCPLQGLGLNIHISGQHLGRTGGMAMQQGLEKGRVAPGSSPGPLSTQGLLFGLVWPPAHLFCALVTHESPPTPPSPPLVRMPPEGSLVSCWHSGSFNVGPGLVARAGSSSPASCPYSQSLAQIGLASAGHG